MGKGVGGNELDKIFKYFNQMFDKVIEKSLTLLRKTAIVNDDLSIVSRKKRLKFIKKIDNELKINFDETFNFVGLLGFWKSKPIRLIPIIESKKPGKKTPDYLSVYKGKRILIECKSSSFNETDSEKLKRRIQKRISKAKKQLKTYSNLPGLCIFQTDNEEIFQQLTALSDLIQEKIDDDENNLAGIIFTYRKDNEEIGKINLNFTLFLNFRSTILLPKGFVQDILDGKGGLLIAAKKGDKFPFPLMEKICKHYGINIDLNKLEQQFKNKNT